MNGLRIAMVLLGAWLLLTCYLDRFHALRVTYMLRDGVSNSEEPETISSLVETIESVLEKRMNIQLFGSIAVIILALLPCARQKEATEHQPAP